MISGRHRSIKVTKKIKINNLMNFELFRNFENIFNNNSNINQAQNNVQNNSNSANGNGNPFTNFLMFSHFSQPTIQQTGVNGNLNNQQNGQQQTVGSGQNIGIYQVTQTIISNGREQIILSSTYVNNNNNHTQTSQSSNNSPNTGRAGITLLDLLNLLQRPQSKDYTEVLSKFTEQKVPETENLKECVICLANIEKGEIQIDTTCKHSFHKECLHKWFKEHNTCPTCRKEY